MFIQESNSRMKNGLLALAGLGLLFLAAFFLVEASHGVEKYLGNEDAYDASDSVEMERQVAYAKTLEVSELTRYFKKLSDEAGAPYAYEILRQVQSSFIEPYNHLFGHIIGDELFKQQNIEGLDVCTSEFTFACYHSVIARVLAEQGFESVDEINEKCLQLKDVGSCQHGIGHGIIAAAGYEDPVSAVAVCDSLEKRPGVTRPCIEGVIMEFNFHQLEDINLGAHRQVDDRGYYYPCTELPDRDKSECVFEQTIWWREIHGRTNYPAVGALCDGVEHEEARVWCYRGIGRLIPEYSSDPVETMARECIGATSVTEGQALCLQMLRDKTDNDGSICDLMEGEYADLCRLPMPELVIE